MKPNSSTFLREVIGSDHEQIKARVTMVKLSLIPIAISGSRIGCDEILNSIWSTQHPSSSQLAPDHERIKFIHHTGIEELTLAFTTIDRKWTQSLKQTFQVAEICLNQAIHLFRTLGSVAQQSPGLAIFVGSFREWW